MEEDFKLSLSHVPHTTSETGFAGCAKTPPSWLTALVHHYEGDKKHMHEFFLSKHFIDGPEIVLICKKCHKRFILTTLLQTPTEETIKQTNVKRDMCAANRENHLHHLHTIISTNTNIASQCCYCNFNVNVVIHEPYMGIQIFDELQKTRHFHKYSDSKKKKSSVENGPCIIDTLDLLSAIINTLVESDRRPRVKLNSKFFISKIGYDSASKAFFDKLGFELEDFCLLPPPLTEDYFIKVKHVTEEINMRLMEICEKASESCYKFYQYDKPYGVLEDILGTKYQSTIHLPFNPTCATYSLSDNYTTLGCVSDMDDKILEWAYKKAYLVPHCTCTQQQLFSAVSTNDKPPIFGLAIFEHNYHENALVDQTIEISDFGEEASNIEIIEESEKEINEINTRTTHEKSKKGQRGGRMGGLVDRLNETSKLGIMNEIDGDMGKAISHEVGNKPNLSELPEFEPLHIFSKHYDYLALLYEMQL
ncbi:8474_t:CDS:2, partial [Cetraspora pellucida]